MPTEIELKFLVPAAARRAVLAELERAPASFARESLAALYIDTPDRRLAQAGLAWRVRREGRRWVQTLKLGGTGALERFEHEAIRPDATHDATEHLGTPAGEQLLSLLGRARQDGLQPLVRFRTEVRRCTRRIRSQGALIEVAFDEGRLLAGERHQRLREIEFELISGPVAPLLALAERWRRRFGLILEPASKAERGDRLALGHEFAPLRKAERPSYPAGASALQAFGTVLDECLAHMLRNAAGLASGDPALRVEHVHQLRVAIRRLRSALRVFEGWVPPPPEALVDELRELFATLGLARDSDVLSSGVAAALAEAGAPPLHHGRARPGPDPAATLRAEPAQRVLLGWISWRAMLDHPAGDTDTPAIEQVDLHRAARKRLRRWHRRIGDDAKAFATLGEEAIHALRKRVKRQRYAVEFLDPLLERRASERYLKALAALQERMGELNDLFVARERYQAMVAENPAAWFALGWLAARLAQARAAVEPALQAFARLDPPSA